MKKIIFTLGMFAFLQPTFLLAQLNKVTESCEVTPCEEGLNCVQTKDGKKCSSCDQSRLKELSDIVSNSCPDLGSYPDKSTIYQDALAGDGRVQVEVFDNMLESEKKCKQAREKRESECWGGGDDGHKQQIDQVTTIIENVAELKKTSIEKRNVYYCSKSTYESRLSTFNSKARLNFEEIEEKIKSSEDDLKDGKKINCSDIEQKGNDCERCADAAKDLLADGFSNSDDKFPVAYKQIYEKAQELQKKAKEVLEAAKEKQLCN
jgi:Novel toxin 16